MNLYLKRPYGPFLWPAHTPEVMRLFGLPSGSNKWPDEGFAPREIQGITVWVEPKDRTKRTFGAEGKFHRVLAQCPLCGRVLSASRLPQHSKVHK